MYRESKILEAVENSNICISNMVSSQFVTFTLGSEEYGVEVMKVKEILGYQGITEVPNMPAFVQGVINLRGLVVPVIDVRLKLGMEKRNYDGYSVVFVLEIDDGTIGIIVDAVSDVISLTAEEMQATPDFTSNINTKIISGMGRKNDKLIILLDIDNLFATTDLQNPSAA